ncbi:MAG: hypothetical protein EXX96DRAFT_474891 [Benjaminiella poitrasii]|nr:MAG: hypothetical protein EXX96DRAFT_474891 [Benjaminiella poitrasii]
MSTASLVTDQSNIFDLNAKDDDSDSIDDSLPTPPHDSQTIAKKPWTPAERRPLHTLPELDNRNTLSSPPSNWALFKGHTHHFLKATLKFIFKDNNLPLLINIVYHLIAARALLARPWKTVTRYLSIPPTPAASHSALRHQIERTTSLAMDGFRVQGIYHLALGCLGALALKERRQSTERSALLVLTLSAVGQAWTHLRAYWKSDHQLYTLKALQEVGSSDLFIALISSVALVKTIRRTGRLV